MVATSFGAMSFTVKMFPDGFDDEEEHAPAASRNGVPIMSPAEMEYFGRTGSLMNYSVCGGHGRKMAAAGELGDTGGDVHLLSLCERPL